eukprot:GHVS01045078.1.p2 GENE.GHVS01045078.1~~GHVS01045078.1.p2  ORF type:complete len:134 (+),score=13.76 GHVS01045078.1:238-639(+)
MMQSTKPVVSSDSVSTTFSATTATIMWPPPLTSCTIKAGPTGTSSACGGMCYFVGDTYLMELLLLYGVLSLLYFSLYSHSPLHSHVPSKMHPSSLQHQCSFLHHPPLHTQLYLNEVLHTFNLAMVALLLASSC